MKIKLVLSYDGANYAGWQVQDNAITIQQVLEDALYSLTGERIKTTASGRTDAGVHALGQVVSFCTNSSIPANKFYLALNSYLPHDVKAISSQQMPEGFDALRCAKKKTYTYTVYESKVEEPLREKYAARINPLTHYFKMKKLSSLLIGTHDFKCFCASKSSAKTTVRTIYSLKIKRNKAGEIKFIICGNGFLYNMVRTLVGTLLKVGRNACDKKDILTMLKDGDRTLCGETMPAKALTLTSVKY